MISKTLLAAAAVSTALIAASAQAHSPAELNDLEIAHVAYTADLIDIRYAHLALAISKNPAVHEFANTMIRDHAAVNEMALALLKRLDVGAKDNFLSQKLNGQSDQLVKELKYPPPPNRRRWIFQLKPPAILSPPGTAWPRITRRQTGKNPSA